MAALHRRNLPILESSTPHGNAVSVQEKQNGTARATNLGGDLGGGFSKFGVVLAQELACQHTLERRMSDLARARDDGLGLLGWRCVEVGVAGLITGWPGRQSVTLQAPPNGRRGATNFIRDALEGPATDNVLLVEKVAIQESISFHTTILARMRLDGTTANAFRYVNTARN